MSCADSALSSVPSSQAPVCVKHGHLLSSLLHPPKIAVRAVCSLYMQNSLFTLQISLNLLLHPSYISILSAPAWAAIGFVLVSLTTTHKLHCFITAVVFFADFPVFRNFFLFLVSSWVFSPTLPLRTACFSLKC